MADGVKAALELKAEGNALYAKQNYLAAYKKYSDAIEIDDENAVLYANRAACSLGLKCFSDVVAGAQKATDIDPGYAKAWARLATAQNALGNFDASVKSWQRALGALPVENLSTVEAKQKEQYESELRNTLAKAKSATAASRDTHQIPRDAAPWVRARALVPELERMGSIEAVKSSAWVILGAASDWDNGMSKMKQLKKVPTATEVRVERIPGALIDLSNAMLRDPRIVHINDNSFLQIYSEQALFEAEMDGAWLTGSAQEVIADAPERQRKEGWASVRAAISTTVRMWILRGYMALGGRDDGPAAIKDYSQALEVLQWGRQAWRNVKKEDRGIIFDDPFFRGVRSIYRSIYLQALMTAQQQASGSDAEDLLNTILEEAQDMLRDISSPETAALPEGIYDPGFVSSFVLYPRGRALSMVGYYHNHIARQLVLQKDASAFEHFTKAAYAYFEAGQMYPEDDELHAWLLHSGLAASKLCGCPISEALPIFEKIRLAIPKMKPIWEYSGLAHAGMDGALQEDVKNEANLRKALQEGRLTPDDFILPEPLQYSL